MEQGRRVTLVAIVLASVPAVAMLGLSNRADERFHPYEFGPDLVRAPWRIVTDAVDLSVRAAGSFGNFRPLGRTVENANYALDELLQQATGLPLHVVLGLVRAASTVLLAVALVTLARRLAGGRSWVGLAVACAFPAFVFAYGGGSSFVVFSGMYLQTTALVVVVALAFTRRWTDRHVGAAVLVLYALMGAAVALFNELAYLAVPLAGAALLATFQRDGVPWRAWPSHPGARAGAATLTGFLVTAVPVRVWLAGLCADGGCYAASDPSVADITPGLWLDRVRSGLVSEALPNGLVAGNTALLASLVLVAAAGIAAALVATRDSRDGRGAPPGPVTDEPAASGRAAGLRVAAVGVALVAASALLSSASPALQEASRTVIGWRDAPTLAAGWALATGGGLAVVADLVVGALTARGLPVRRVTGATVGTFVAVGVMGAAVASLATVAQHHRDDTDPRLLLTERIGAETASFDRSPGGDERRCALLDEFDRRHPDRPDQLAQLLNALGPVTTSRYGHPFCEASP